MQSNQITKPVCKQMINIKQEYLINRITDI